MKLLKEFDEIYTDDEYEELREKYINKPYDKESLYYREIFENIIQNKKKQFLIFGNNHLAINKIHL